LLDECIDYIGGGERAGRKALRIEPDAHGVFALAEDHHVAHAGHALERILDVDIEIVGDELGRVAAIFGIEASSENKVEVGLGDGDAGGVDRGGQAPGDAGHAVLHVHGGDVEIVAGLEGGGDGADAAVGAGRIDVAHPLDAIDGLFKRNGDGLLDGVGVGAHIDRGDDDLRRSERGIHGDGKVGNAHRSRQNDEQRANRGEDRPTDKKIDKQDEPSFFACGERDLIDARCPPPAGGA